MTRAKVGDHVRGVTEGKVLHIGANGWLGLDNNGALPPVGETGVVSIEVLPKPFVMPTKRFAQVIEGDLRGMWYVLWTRPYPDADDGSWTNSEGDMISNADLLTRPNIRVISEGVDEWLSAHQEQ